MSTHLDVKSESMSRSEVEVVPTRRVTIFERPEIIEGLSPAVIGAIQRELVEMRIEFEKKMEEIELRSDRRVCQLLDLASSERLDLEKMRMEAPSKWEEGTERSSKRSRSQSKSQQRRPGQK